MPLGDFFAPDPVMVCPCCGLAIPEWEGFGGPGAFLLFKQGDTAPSESRLPSQVPDGGVKLEDGRITLFATCRDQHSLMADAVIEDGVFTGVEMRDADGGDSLPLVGDFLLWRSLGSRYSVSTLAPTKAQGVVPSSITNIGYNKGCILACRRADTRDPTCDDEWFFVDVVGREVLGPVPEPELKERIKARGLEVPEMMKLPEDIA